MGGEGKEAEGKRARGEEERTGKEG